MRKSCRNALSESGMKIWAEEEMLGMTQEAQPWIHSDN